MKIKFSFTLHAKIHSIIILIKNIFFKKQQLKMFSFLSFSTIANIHIHVDGKP
jgi:hypothetical protein